MADETATKPKKETAKDRDTGHAPESLKEAREMAEAGKTRRTDHLSGAGPQYGEVSETGAEAYNRLHENATGKHEPEIAIPTSSLDTANLAEVKGVLPQDTRSMPAIGEAQEETMTSGIKADAETAGAGDNVKEKAAMRGALPDDFPGVEKLRAENLTTYGALRKYRGRFTEISGIGESTEAKIREAAGLDDSSDDDKEPA